MRKTFSHWEFHEGKSDDMMNSRINRHNVVELQMGRHVCGEERSVDRNGSGTYPTIGMHLERGIPD